MGRDVIFDHASPLEIEIMEDYRNVFNTMVDLPSRKDFVYNLKEIEFQIPVAIIGMKFTYVFEDLKIEVEPINIKAHEKAIHYAEHHYIAEKDLNYILHFTLTGIGDNICKYVLHISPHENSHLSEDHRKMIRAMQEKSMESLKRLVES